MAGVAASVLYAIASVSTTEMLLLWLVGTVGGILPDVDSDHSTAIKLIFGLLVGAACITLLMLLADQLSLIELWLSMIGIALTTRLLVIPIFVSQTRHRGIFHSILAGVFFCFLVTAFASLHFQPFFSWTLGFFCVMGFLVHLILDECYSVDLLNIKIKRSLGSALKPLSLKYKTASAVMLALTLMAWRFTPSMDEFYQHYFSQRFVSSVYEALLPDPSFFGLLDIPANTPVESDI